MKKHSLFALFLLLTSVIVLSITSVAFATNGDTSASPNTYTTLKIVEIIAVYGVFIIAIFVGIPVLKRISKRTKTERSEGLLTEAKNISAKLSDTLAKGDKVLSKRDAIKLSISFGVLADKALTAYTEQQVEGYLDMYNFINKIKAKALLLEKLSGDEYHKAFSEITSMSLELTNKANFLSEREKKISRYNA
ncbi:MAG: hypothetical protein RR357_03240 [Clostridia bacterium]